MFIPYFDKFTKSPLSLQTTESTDRFGDGLEEESGDESSDDPDQGIDSSSDEDVMEEDASSSDESNTSNESAESGVDGNFSDVASRNCKASAINAKIKRATQEERMRLLDCMLKKMNEHASPDGQVSLSKMNEWIETQRASKSNTPSSQIQFCTVCNNTKLVHKFRERGTCAQCYAKQEKVDKKRQLETKPEQSEKKMKTGV